MLTNIGSLQELPACGACHFHPEQAMSTLFWSTACVSDLKFTPPENLRDRKGSFTEKGRPLLHCSLVRPA